MDFSINCSDSVHQSAAAFATFMVLAFSAGLPLLYLMLLIPHRNGCASLSGRSQAALADIQMLRFFYMDYKPQYWYWGLLSFLAHCSKL